MRESGLASWAIAYAGCGFRLFPLQPGDKLPLHSGWQRSATGDPRRLCAMFADESRNIGALAGIGFDVFDVEAAYVELVLERLGGQWPATPRSRTGRGGVHLFVQPVGVDGSRKLRLDEQRVGDLKSRGGLVVLPPSTTQDQYTWEHAPAGLAPCAAPAALLELVVEPRPPAHQDAPAASLSARSAGRILAGLVATVAGAPEGERNDRLFWAACRAHEHGLPASVALPPLRAAALEVGLTERAIGASLRSAARTVTSR